MDFYQTISGPHSIPPKLNIILCREMSKDSETKWTIAGSKRPRGMKSHSRALLERKKKSTQENRTGGNSGIQSYNPSDEHRRVDERSSRNNCFINGPSVAQDCHQTGISKDANLRKGPSNGRHSTAKQINQLQTTSTKNHSYRHCPESTSCSTYGLVDDHPRNPVGRKNDKVEPQGKGRGTNGECSNATSAHFK